MYSDQPRSERTPWSGLHPAPDDLAFRDDLTGLYNYRLLARLLVDQWDEMIGRCPSLSLIIIDLDLFKQVNDRYGHLVGDEVLRITASILREHFREDDFLFRYGGDEFVILAGDVDAAGATELAERARRALRGQQLRTREEKERIRIPVSFSIGVASFPEDGRREVLLDAADRRLYLDKEHRRRPRTWRRRALVPLLSLLIPVALLLGLFARRDSVAPPVEPTLAALGETDPLPAPDPVTPTEREELLGRIQLLRSQLDETLSQKMEAEPDEAPHRRNDEIAQLRQRIAELNSQLQATAAPPASELPRGRDLPAPTVDPVPPPGQGAAPPLPEPAPPVIVPPRLIRRAPIHYPPIARRMEREAAISVWLLIDSQGEVIRAEAKGPRIGLGFEQAAEDAARRSKWAPGTRDGRPATMEANLVVAFRMN